MRGAEGESEGQADTTLSAEPDDPEIMIRAETKSRTPNRLSHPGNPNLL